MELKFKPFGLPIESHLPKIRLDKSNVQQIQPKNKQKTVRPIVSLYLCQYKKAVNDPVLYCIYFKELCDSLIGCVPILLMVQERVIK